MDQAISIMGMPGIAKLVEFNPVGAPSPARPLIMPPGVGALRPVRNPWLRYQGQLCARGECATKNLPA